MSKGWQSLAQEGCVDSTIPQVRPHSQEGPNPAGNSSLLLCVLWSSRIASPHSAPFIKTSAVNTLKLFQKESRHRLLSNGPGLPSTHLIHNTGTSLENINSLAHFTVASSCPNHCWQYCFYCCTIEFNPVNGQKSYSGEFQATQWNVWIQYQFFWTWAIHWILHVFFSFFKNYLDLASYEAVSLVSWGNHSDKC